MKADAFINKKSTKKYADLLIKGAYANRKFEIFILYFVPSSSTILVLCDALC
jgi:hypothetical protein